MVRILIAAIALVLVRLSSGAALAQDVSKYPLMVIEQHRASVIKAIVDKWSQSFSILPGVEKRTPIELSSELWTLRSDRLLAASLAGSYITVAQVLSDSRLEAGGGIPQPALKVLGDSTDDLTFTPVTPCRIVDTRAAGGPLSAGVARTFVGFAASFASQGGVNANCNIPNGVGSLALNVAAVQPSAAGFITLWQANVARPSTGSTVNYAADAFATATGTVVPVDAGVSNQFSAWSPAGVDMVVDVVGYFRSPAAGSLDCYRTGLTSVVISGGSAFGDSFSPACTTGYAPVTARCNISGFGYLTAIDTDGVFMHCRALSGANDVSDTLQAGAQCCRMPGH